MKFCSKTLLLFTLLSLATNLKAQHFEWAKSFGGFGLNEGVAINADDTGFVYLTGSFRTAVSFGSAIGPSTTLFTNGYENAFFAKFDTNGNCIWAKSLGSGLSSSRGTAITVDDLGNVHILGRASVSNLTGMDLDPGPGTSLFFTQNWGGTFQLKLTPNGDYIWAKVIEQGALHPNSLSIDASGNIYTSGKFSNTIDLDPGTGVHNVSQPSGNVFIQKLDSSGNFVWGHNIGSYYGSGGWAVIDNQGNVYSAGSFLNTVDFDPGTGTLNKSSLGSNDIFIQKLDSSGNLVWVRTYGTSAYEVAGRIEIDDFGHLYVSGVVSDTITFEAGNNNSTLETNTTSGFLLKLDTAGDFVWVKDIGIGVSSIHVQESGQLWLAGSLNDTVSFGSGAGLITTASNGLLDGYAMRMDTAGNVIWIGSVGSTANDYINSITGNNSGSIFTTGRYRFTTDLNPNAAVQSFTPTGTWDIFVQKFSRCVTDSTVDYQTVCDSLTWIDGNTYFTSTNIPTHILINSNGCDSLVTLDLTLLNSSAIVDTLIACDSLTWIDGNTYYSSTDTISAIYTNSVGCDSIVTLNLTINNSNYTTDIQKACDSYTWIDGITYNESNDTVTHVVSNSVGCDSIITLNLTIEYSNSGIDVLSSCDSLTWIDGTTYYHSTNSATYTLTNAQGCDSTVTLDLTILDSDSSSVSETACESFTWPLNSVTYTSSGIHNTTLTNIEGCDSVVSLNLTIEQNKTTEQIILSCGNYEWPLTNQTYDSNGVYSVTLASTATCDSIVNLNLTILNPDTSVSMDAPKLTANAQGAHYQWLNCDSAFTLITGETSKDFTPTLNGRYAVEIRELNCTDTSSCYLVTNAEVESPPNYNLLLYPNPTRGRLNIDFEEEHDDINIHIYNTLGQIIFYKGFGKTDFSEIDLDFSAGVYYIAIASHEQSLGVYKVVKQGN